MKELFVAIEDRFAKEFERKTKGNERDDFFAAVTELIEFEREVGVEQGDKLQRLHKEMLIRERSTEQLILGHLEHIRSRQLQVCAAHNCNIGRAATTSFV